MEIDIMFVRLSYWKCLPEYWGADRELFESSAVKIMAAHEGFVRAQLLGTPGGSQRIAFTTWANKADYEKFVKSPDLQNIIVMFEHMYEKGGSPAPVEYEVRAQGDSL